MTITLHHSLLLGYWGTAPFPWLLILSYDHRNNKALIAHEECHQAQQRRDGVFKFWYRYLTDKSARYQYELEAYRVWLDVEPGDLWRVVSMMNNYGFDVSHAEIVEALTLQRHA